MKSGWAHGARLVAIGAIGVAMVFALGCRKSKTKHEEERREELNRLRARELKRQEAVVSSRQQYEHAKELLAERKYDEAWEEFEDAAGHDEAIDFEFDVYKSEKLPEELFRVADDLQSIENERFNEAYRTLLFVRDHMEKKRAKAQDKINELIHRRDGHNLYKGALKRIDAYQRAEGIRMLEEVRDNYHDTPYGDKAIQKLRKLQPPPEISPD